MSRYMRTNGQLGEISRYEQLWTVKWEVIWAKVSSPAHVWAEMVMYAYEQCMNKIRSYLGNKQFWVKWAVVSSSKQLWKRDNQIEQLWAKNEQLHEQHINKISCYGSSEKLWAKMSNYEQEISKMSYNSMMDVIKNIVVYLKCLRYMVLLRNYCKRNMNSWATVSS